MSILHDKNSAEKPNFEKIFSLRNNFKYFLQERFGIIKVENRDSASHDGKSSSQAVDFLNCFLIEKKNPSIYLSINSINDLQIKKEKVMGDFDSFIHEFNAYFDRIEKQLDVNSTEGLEIISKTLQNRRKKFETALKRFKPEDTWGVDKISEEFSHELMKLFKDLIDATMTPIMNGIERNSCYQDILKFENKFLADMGIYTEVLSIGDKLNNWDNIFPQECENGITKNKDDHEKIKDVLSYPYLFSEKLVVYEAKVTLWKYQES
jgi:hypothetical protein